MKTLYLTFISFTISFTLIGQNYDAQWPFGYGNNLPNGFGISALNFRNNVVTIDLIGGIDSFELGSRGSFICGRDGEIELLTNNCRILDKDFKTIEYGRDINPGEINRSYCYTSHGFYPIYQAAVLLPDLDIDSVKYLVHADGEIWDQEQDVVSRNLYLSSIVERNDGTFYLKETRNLLNINTITGRITAGLNREGNKWWTWTVGYNTNKFYKFLVGGETGVEGPIIQQIGPRLATRDLDIGQSSFSPDGTMLAINSERYGVLLYDFDNETGELSNHRAIVYPNMETGKGLCFSPDSRFIYLTTAMDVYQVDLWENNEINHIGTYFSFAEDGWPVGLGYMFIGPDCRIYVSLSATTYYLHTIHHPNRKGMECDFAERAIRTPTKIPFHLPNMPMYRFGGACDSTIRWSITGVDAVEFEDQLHLYPNPTSTSFTLQLPENLQAESLRIISTTSAVLKTQKIKAGEKIIEVPTVNLPAGVYFLQLRTEGGAVITERFVVAR